MLDFLLGLQYIKSWSLAYITSITDFIGITKKINRDIYRKFINNPSFFDDFIPFNKENNLYIPFFPNDPHIHEMIRTIDYRLSNELKQYNTNLSKLNLYNFLDQIIISASLLKVISSLKKRYHDAKKYINDLDIAISAFMKSNNIMVTHPQLMIDEFLGQVIDLWNKTNEINPSAMHHSHLEFIQWISNTELLKKKLLIDLTKYNPQYVIGDLDYKRFLKNSINYHIVFLQEIRNGSLEDSYLLNEEELYKKDAIYRIVARETFNQLNQYNSPKCKFIIGVYAADRCRAMKIYDENLQIMINLLVNISSYNITFKERFLDLFVNSDITFDQMLNDLEKKRFLSNHDLDKNIGNYKHKIFLYKIYIESLQYQEFNIENNHIFKNILGDIDLPSLESEEDDDDFNLDDFDFDFDDDDEDEDDKI